MSRILKAGRNKPILRLIKQAFTDNYVLLLFILWGLCYIQNKHQMPICFIHFREKKRILQAPLRIELLLIKHNAQGAHKN